MLAQSTVTQSTIVAMSRPRWRAGTLCVQSAQPICVCDQQSVLEATARYCPCCDKNMDLPIRTCTQCGWRIPWHGSFQCEICHAWGCSEFCESTMVAKTTVLGHGVDVGYEQAKYASVHRQCARDEYRNCSPYVCCQVTGICGGCGQMGPLLPTTDFILKRCRHCGTHVCRGCQITTAKFPLHAACGPLHLDE